MTLRLRDRTFELLRSSPNKRYKAREIAEWIHETYPDETAAKILKSSFLHDDSGLLMQIVAEIGSNRPQWQKRFPNLRTTEGRPRQYYWTEKSEVQEIQEAESEGGVGQGKIDGANFEEITQRILEKDLYPILIDFVGAEFQAKAFRIDESRASNRRGPGGNRWLYPDVVAVEALTNGLNREVIEALRNSGDQRARLWSFEVKKLLNRSNVRESYFQAVSNSSWSNFGYLVASEIEGADTLREIQMLYAVHGIGLIELDVGTPTESTIRIPARERSGIEWSMCSRLADENSDFQDFIKRVRKFYQTGDV